MVTRETPGKIVAIQDEKAIQEEFNKEHSQEQAILNSGAISTFMRPNDREIPTVTGLPKELKCQMDKQSKHLKKPDCHRINCETKPENVVFWQIWSTALFLV